MICIKRDDLFDAGVFVVYKYFQINRTKEIQIYLILIVSDRHYKGSILVEQPYFLIEGQFAEFNPSDHVNSRSKKPSHSWFSSRAPLKKSIICCHTSFAASST
jgi:hypothetical protein